MSGSAQLLALLNGPRIMPVVTIAELRHAVPLARALVTGGLPAIEITMRSEIALDAIRAIAEEVPEAILGAGTILTPAQLGQAARAGARFIVSPGQTAALLQAARQSTIPFLPGCVTPAEIMSARDEGFTFVKFFPAEAAGGVRFLSALASPLAEMRFCPTGGIHPGNVQEYLSLPNVTCVGGSWLTPAKLVQAEDWAGITALAATAAAIA